MSFNIEKMNYEFAKSIIKWSYPKPYDIYNMENSEESLNELLSGSYFSVTLDNQLVGFFCYGEFAQIPIKEALSFYNDNNFLDIGLGLNPDLCNRGYGVKFVLAGMNYAINRFSLKQFRLTVASFNQRAIKVYQRVGFKIEESFIRPSDMKEFYIMRA